MEGIPTEDLVLVHVVDIKYDRIGVVLVNAVKEQQAQIEKQQEQLKRQQEQITQQQQNLYSLANSGRLRWLNSLGMSINRGVGADRN